jgi:hypothetical protein
MSDREYRSYTFALTGGRIFIVTLPDDYDVSDLDQIAAWLDLMREAIATKTTIEAEQEGDHD